MNDIPDEPIDGAPGFVPQRLLFRRPARRRSALHPLVRGILLLSGCLCLLGTGCTSPRLKDFPVGIYSVPSTNDFPAIRAAGFNLITTGVDAAHLDAAQAAGLKVLASPGTTAGPKFEADRARDSVRRFDRHPALWAWYLIDEPDMHGVSPEAVRDAHRFLKNLGVTKPTSLVLYQGASALDYANIADITMIDRYPIPWLPLANFPQHLRMTRLALGPKKPMIAVIQAFDWNAYRKLLPGRDQDLRPPTFEELRCMTFCALARQASGIFYFAYDSGGWKLAEHPEVWESLQRVVAEVNELKPLFQAEHPWWHYDHDFGDVHSAYNGALESSVIPVLLRVRQGNDAVLAGDYVLTVNTTPLAHQYRFTAPASYMAEVPVLGEGRSRPIVNGWVNDDFAPFAVHVYGPFVR
jgi:hypothetical protein